MPEVSFTVEHDGLPVATAQQFEDALAANEVGRIHTVVSQDVHSGEYTEYSVEWSEEDE